ncbi:MAG: radical SAM protein [Candidatus Tectomicrobia bacterium]|uniref:Radical SAM protein n=1 Tax=Tectimicrobiota bacterium TaxID=2528274 RepID=A0A933GL23_UNCTE|nr:radical SAM protein [Candidatus Tectomicrobia bacterium]
MMDSNILLFGLRLGWGRLTGKTYPFLIQFSVTNRCNSRCRYCYATYYNRSSDDLPLEQVKLIIDGLVSRGLFRLNLVGGEPLVRSDIGSIIEHVHRRKVHCAMTTNGILVPEKLDLLRELNMVSFSLDGSPEGNDLNRCAGAFDKAMAGMEVCKSAGIPFQISAVLTRYTVEDVDFLTKLAERYGCQVGFTTLISQARENHSGERSFFPDNKEVVRALKRIIELKRSGKPILFSTEAYNYALHWPDYTQDIMMGKVPGKSYGFSPPTCFAGKYFSIIDYNGDVYPCPQLVGLVKPKNLFFDGFDETFRHASQHDCQACSMPCSNEFSLFFGLRPAILWEHLCGYRY